jgi:hypothetical protein
LLGAAWRLDDVRDIIGVELAAIFAADVEG